MRMRMPISRSLSHTLAPKMRLAKQLCSYALMGRKPYLYGSGLSSLSALLSASLTGRTGGYTRVGTGG